MDVKICTLSCIFRTVDFYSTLVIQSSFIIQYLHNSDKKCLVFLNCFNTKYVLFDITVFGMYFSLLMDIIISMCNDFQLNLFMFFSTILLNWTCVCFLPGLLECFFFFRDSFLPITFVEVLYIKIWWRDLNLRLFLHPCNIPMVT